jgi:hypothetical protein
MVGCRSSAGACSRCCIHSSAARCTTRAIGVAVGAGQCWSWVSLWCVWLMDGWPRSGGLLGQAAQVPAPTLRGTCRSQAAATSLHLVREEREEDPRRHGAAELVRVVTGGGGICQRGGVQQLQNASQQILMQLQQVERQCRVARQGMSRGREIMAAAVCQQPAAARGRQAGRLPALPLVTGKSQEASEQGEEARRFCQPETEPGRQPTWPR